MWEAAGWRGWSPMEAGVARGGGENTRRVLLTLSPPVLTHSSLIACFAPLHLFRLLPGHVVLGSGRMEKGLFYFVNFFPLLFILPVAWCLVRARNI